MFYVFDTSKIILGKDYQVEIRFTNIVFTEKMNNPHSKEYHDVKLAITSAVCTCSMNHMPSVNCISSWSIIYQLIYCICRIYNV